jgi:hypothetical protein
LFANHQGLSPLNLAIKHHHNDSIEVMLEILTMKHTEYNYFKHLKPYFIQLLEMHSETFTSFFDSCHTDVVEMHGRISHLEHGPKYVTSHTQFISAEGIKEKLKALDKHIEL